MDCSQTITNCKSRVNSSVEDMSVWCKSTCMCVYFLEKCKIKKARVKKRISSLHHLNSMYTAWKMKGFCPFQNPCSRLSTEMTSINEHDLIQSIKSSFRLSPEVANYGQKPGV